MLKLICTSENGGWGKKTKDSLVAKFTNCVRGRYASQLLIDDAMIKIDASDTNFVKVIDDD